MTAIRFGRVTYRIGRKRLPVAWDSLGILITYVGALYILYSRSPSTTTSLTEPVSLNLMDA